MNLEKRVRRGVKWLDKNVPNWADQISVDLLDMSDGNYCIIGQTTAMGGWTDRVHKLGLRDSSHDFGMYEDSRPDAWRLGFQTRNGEPGSTYEALTNLWSREVELRKGMRVLDAIRYISELPVGTRLAIKVLG